MLCQYRVFSNIDRMPLSSSRLRQLNFWTIINYFVTERKGKSPKCPSILYKHVHYCKIQFSDSSIIHGEEVINWFEFLHFVYSYTFCRPKCISSFVVLLICFCCNKNRLIRLTVVPNVHLSTTWIIGIRARSCS